MPVKKLWFKAKKYGWGWYPVTWQGWLVVLAYVAFNFLVAMSLVTLIPGVIVSTATLLYICMKKGDPLRWRWGKRSEKTKNAP